MNNRPSHSASSHSDRSSQALLDAARHILETEGLPALTVRRVADAAGCTTMQVYSRFGGKEGLLRALFDEGFALLAQAQQSVPGHLSPVDRVCQLCAQYLQVARAHPHHYALMLGGHSAEFEPPPQSRLQALHTLMHLVDAVEQALPDSPQRRAQAELLARQLVAFCHGWAMLAPMGLVDATQDRSSAEQVVRALLAAPPLQAPRHKPSGSAS